MKHLTKAGLMISLVCMFALSSTSLWAQEWSVKGNLVGSCSCNPACPCAFGSPPTHQFCEGNDLLEVKEGHYGDVKLDGLSVVSAGRIGEWVKYYVSETATDKQASALGSLMAALYEMPEETKVLSTEKVLVSVERTKAKVKFSVPESTVEIEMMNGWDGKPIKIHNLPRAYLLDYTQYKSVTNEHSSKDKKFSYSGTNGTTARVDASGKK